MVKVKTTVVVGLISHGIMISKQLNLVQLWTWLHTIEPYAQEGTTFRMETHFQGGASL
jgi:hypothetical protein